MSSRRRRPCASSRSGMDAEPWGEFRLQRTDAPRDAPPRRRRELPPRARSRDSAPDQGRRRPHKVRPWRLRARREPARCDARACLGDLPRRGRAERGGNVCAAWRACLRSSARSRRSFRTAAESREPPAPRPRGPSRRRSAHGGVLIGRTLRTVSSRLLTRRRAPTANTCRGAGPGARAGPTSAAAARPRP